MIHTLEYSPIHVTSGSQNHIVQKQECRANLNHKNTETKIACSCWFETTSTEIYIKCLTTSILKCRAWLILNHIWDPRWIQTTIMNQVCYRGWLRQQTGHQKLSNQQFRQIQAKPFHLLLKRFQRESKINETRSITFLWATNWDRSLTKANSHHHELRLDLSTKHLRLQSYQLVFFENWFDLLWAMNEVWESKWLWELNFAKVFFFFKSKADPPFIDGERGDL